MEEMVEKQNTREEQEFDKLRDSLLKASSEVGQQKAAIEVIRHSIRKSKLYRSSKSNSSSPSFSRTRYSSRLRQKTKI